MEEASPLMGFCIASLVFLVCLIGFFSKKKKKNDNNDPNNHNTTRHLLCDSVAAAADGDENNKKDRLFGKEVNATNSHKTDPQPAALRNVFSVKQKPLIVVTGKKNEDLNSSTSSTSSSSSSSTSSSSSSGKGRERTTTKTCSSTTNTSCSSTGGRPFDSSYYFAHNRHSNGGGYKDGLRAEDYVMNGPRLLSKGGTPWIDDNSKSSSPEAINNEGNEGGEVCTTPPFMETTNFTQATNSYSYDAKRKKTVVPSTPITRYMWDDNGNGNIAKIHIDSLPISSSSIETIPWENAGIHSIEQIEVRLLGDNQDGLYIGISSHDGKRRYHLHVPKMYGEAVSVKAFPKRHKLVVKITKKETMRKKRHPPSSQEQQQQQQYRRHTSTSSQDDGRVWTMMTKSLKSIIGGVGSMSNYRSNYDDAEEAEERSYQSSWPSLSSASSVGGGLGCDNLESYD